MRAILRWAARVLGTAAATVLVIVALPHASRLMSAILPDLSGAAMNASITLSHRMEESARLETSVVRDEGILNSTTEALFIGQVQSVTIQYVYEASLGIDLKKVDMRLDGRTITFTLPEPEILQDSLTPTSMVRDDFWYPLTDERRMKLLEDEKAKCREKTLKEYASSDAAWQNTVSALSATVEGWLGTGYPGVIFRYEQAAK